MQPADNPGVIQDCDAKGGLRVRDCPPRFMIGCLNVKIITRKALGPNACSRGRSTHRHRVCRFPCVTKIKQGQR